MKRSLILPLVAALVIAAAITQAQNILPAKMRSAKAAERQAAVNSIQTQLKAFGRDDYKTAITYQSAGLKKNFSSVDAFRTMMVRVYPEFAHYKTVVFGPAQCDPAGAHLAIPVSVIGQDGVTVKALYLMVREGKIYRVEGVLSQTQPPPDLTGPSTDV